MKTRGYTLVEIMVAAVVFTVSVASVFSSVSAFRVPLENSTKKLRAAQMAKKKMEFLRQQVMNPTSAWLDTSSPHHGTASSPLPDDPEFPNYHWWYDASNAPGSTIKVELTVRTPP